MGKVATPKRIPGKRRGGISSEEIAELICYYFPSYKYHEARKLPQRRAVRMLKTARRESARILIDIAQIIYSQSGKNSTRKKIINNLEQRANG